MASRLFIRVQPTGLPFLIGSRLVPAANFEDPNKADLVQAILNTVKTTSFTALFAVAPYYYEDDGATSVNPAWRNSIWHVRTERCRLLEVVYSSSSPFPGAFFRAMGLQHDRSCQGRSIQ